ncbi:VOC family protein [Nocardioides sp. SYSU D00038]|uniref:VOC family protein n=1 Tax=Nocardioides sp. SYSU D00038 TaxID=2812554 RepID=UPI0019675737|nr:VOC family protein [Nocardioides sp. SYSU D00038]
MPDRPPASQPDAVWQDLCIDALDPSRLGRFWAAVTGLTLVDEPDHVHLDGPTPRHRIWVNEVDRPKTVKNRLHLDVDVASVDEVVALGATVLAPAEETGLGWTVLADPEGHEFCAFVREPDRLPAYRLHGVGVDCVDAERLARWWGERFGVEPEDHDGWWTLSGVASDERMTLDFSTVPEPRQGPNRVHWDVVGRVEDFLAAGATHLWDTEHWVVLADPEGHEFCVFAPGGDDAEPAG